jgi:hypothetical protein
MQELDGSSSELSHARDPRLELAVTESDDRTHAQLLGRARQNLPASRAVGLNEQHVHHATRFRLPLKLRGKDAGVVHDEQIAEVQERW